MFAAVRIVSLLPAATEIVCALGARAELVGRSHECDFPPDVEGVPVLTSSRVGPLPSSQAIDTSVRDVLRDALAIYQIDVERLRESAPDVIVTQDLCEVCAVSIDDVRAAVARLGRQDVAIVNLHPMRLADIWRDVVHVAGAIGRAANGEALVAPLRAGAARGVPGPGRGALRERERGVRRGSERILPVDAAVPPRRRSETAPPRPRPSERREVVPDAAADDHRAAEVPDVLAVDVHARIPPILLVTDADAETELEVVGSGRDDPSATPPRLDAAHQVEHAQLEGAEQALAVTADVVLGAQP